MIVSLLLILLHNLEIKIINTTNWNLCMYVHDSYTTPSIWSLWEHSVLEHARL